MKLGQPLMGADVVVVEVEQRNGSRRGKGSQNERRERREIEPHHMQGIDPRVTEEFHHPLRGGRSTERAAHGRG